MIFLNFAKEVERKGFEHYTKLADATPVREIAGIFLFLAREEKRHLEIFEAWDKGAAIPSIEDFGISKHAVKAFQILSEHFKTAGTPAINHDDAYEKALEFENKSIRFYTEALNGNAVSDESQKTILESIIDQEKTHARLITSLMEFQRHPGEWLENAEFRHPDDY
ncbi:MAG: ferritin family protein [Chitinispirillaceae bacterium]|nr:ferritin family protein [Chitinispirillaceae bacterium]